MEIKIVRFLNRIGRGKIDWLTGLVSSIPFLAVLWSILVFSAFLFFPQIREVLIARVFIVAILHFGITEGIFKYLILKFVAMRKRPYLAYPDQIEPVGHQFSDSSFPSSHMASTLGMLVVLSSFFPSYIFPAVFFSLFMAFARIHNGMHYPSDIFIGAMMGLLYGAVAVWIA